MKLASPAEPRAELSISETTLNAPGSTQSCSPTSSDRAALLFEVAQLASTHSVAETLEMAARLLAEMEISVSVLRLDRHGFITDWKASQFLESTSRSENEARAPLATSSVRVGTTMLEAYYRGSSGKLAERTVSAFLKAAAIQAERLSRRVWKYAAAEESGSGNHRTDTTDRTPKLSSEKARRLEADIERVARFPHGILITGETGTGKPFRRGRFMRSRRARRSRSWN